MVHDNYRIPDPTDKSGQGLGRGFILRNSTVGAAALTLDLFLYRYVCGNNIIWGFRHLANFRRRHVGQGDTLYANWLNAVSEIVEYVQSAPADDALFIERAATREIEASKEDTIIALQKLMTKQLATKAYEMAEVQGLNPRTPWGIANGLTFSSQRGDHQDARWEQDTLASSVLRSFVKE